MSDRNRTYNEQEIRALIQRATELHSAAADTSQRSLKLNEVKHIAAELGLPSEYVEAAALELTSTPEASKKSNIFGAPFVINETRVVPYTTVTDAQWEQIVMDIRAATSKKGRTDELGATREWQHLVGEGEDGLNFVRTQVTVRPTDDHTSVRIRKGYGGIAIPAYLLAFSLVTFFTIVFLEASEGMGLPDLVNWLILISASLGSLAGVRSLITRWSTRKQETFTQLADRIQHTLTPVTPPAPLELSATESSAPLPAARGQIELPDADELATPASPTASRLRS